MKTETELKTYVIQIPDCSGSFAAFDFEEDDWRSTNDLAKTWQVDEFTASDAADNFRETFEIDRTNHIFAILLSEAIEEETAAVLMNLTYSHNDRYEVVIKSCSTRATGVLVIPDVVGGLPVTRIESWAFAGCSGLTHVSIPSSVTSIGNAAFQYCRGLTSVTIGNSLTSIGDGAFSGCRGLTSVTIPNSVTVIGYVAFQECTGLTSVTLPSSLTSIGDWAFERCSGLTSMTIPNSMTSIGNNAFYECSGLTSVTLPSSLTSIGYGAFDGCTGLTSVTVDVANSFYTSDDGVLFNKAKTSLITFPARKTGGYTIPNSVTKIDAAAFQYCSGLTSMTIPDSVTVIGDFAFSECSGLTSVTLPDSVTKIGDWAFYGCSGLTSVTIPSSIKSIGEAAFDECVKLKWTMEPPA